jgi:hypothetical protein
VDGMPSGERMVFALDNLAIFERHGATVGPCDEPPFAGCWVKLPNGWTLSVQWGYGSYGSNYHWTGDRDRKVPDAVEAEIAVWKEGDGSLVEWVDGETVVGYCSMERVLHVLDLVARDELMQDVPQEAKRLAVDNWQRFEDESEGRS